jgi:hypothetical protein
MGEVDGEGGSVRIREEIDERRRSSKFDESSIVH